MRISNLSVLTHTPAESAALASPNSEHGISVVTVTTDDGTSGTTFLDGASPDAAAALVRVLRPVLLGRDPLRIGALWRDMWRLRRKILPAAMGAVDVALWDLAGKVAGLPVHRMLGSGKASVPAYFSAAPHTSPEQFADEARYWREQGWTGYKLHPPTQHRLRGEAVEVAADIAACAAVHDAVGDRMSLMLDAAWAYDYAEAMRVGRAIEDMRFTWYEDPLPADDLSGTARLCAKLDIPVIATEATPGGVYALPQWIAGCATDALRGDVAIKGGITGLMKIAHLAEAHHLPFEVHHGYTAVNNVATLHVIAACDNARWFEVLPLNRADQRSLQQFWYGLAEPPVIDNAGLAWVPDEPGLGVEIDWDVLRSGSVREFS